MNNKTPLEEVITASFEEVKREMVELGYVVNETTMRMYIAPNDDLEDAILNNLGDIPHGIEIVYDPSIEETENEDGSFSSDIYIEAIEI